MSDRYWTIGFLTCVLAAIVVMTLARAPGSYDACLRACGAQGVAEVDAKRCLCRSVTSGAAVSALSDGADAAPDGADAASDGAVP